VALEVDAVFRALADETRRDLFQALAHAPGQSTSQLVALTPGMTRWGVMKHLAVLRDAGLIQTMAEGRQRRHFPEKGGLRTLRQWLDEVAPG
jgi:DNA-binding transcriptional ArsR family regulator